MKRLLARCLLVLGLAAASVVAAQAPAQAARLDCPNGQRICAWQGGEFTGFMYGLTAALTEWMPLSERSRISRAIYDSLRGGDLEVRFADGLEMLRLADLALAEQTPTQPGKDTP